MRCPVCSTALRRVRTRSFIVSICTKCKGIWFDAETFLPFAKKLSTESQTKSSSKITFQPRNVVTSEQVIEDARLCPNCQAGLHKFNYAYDSNIFLDKCKNCKGIWTDAGEIQQVASYLKKDPRLQEIGSYLVKRDRQLEDITSLSDALSRPVSPLIWFAPRIILPVGDDLSREKPPLTNIAFIAICTIVFVLIAIAGGPTKSFFQQYGFVPARWLGIGLITSMFLHADIFHILGNMYFLWLFGDNVEDRLGHVKYILFYLAAGLAADFLHGLIHINSTIPAVGASGAISGVMGAYMVFYPHARIKVFIFYTIVNMSAAFYLGTWFAFQLLWGFYYTKTGVSGVGWFAHIGGFIFGAAYAFLVKRTSTLKANVE